MNCNQINKSRQSLLKSALMLAICGSVHIEAQAALPADAILAFDSGQTVCLAGGAPPNCTYSQQDVTGSYFAMDTNGDGIFSGNEKMAIEMNEGVRLGDIQPASGSHEGSPDGSELPSIDMPWVFFGNTGMHQSTTPLVIANGDDGSGDNVASVDFSGLGVTWNGIPNIPLGGDSANFSDTGIAVVTCDAGCDVGDNFTLDYLAHVPLGDPSGFGGVFYTMYLEGVVDSSTPLPPTKSVSIQLTGGNTHECSSPDGAIIEASANIVTTDTSDIVSVNWELDGIDAGSGSTVNILSSLGGHTLSVSVDTLASGMFDSNETIAVNDTVAPDLEISFIDGRSGVQISEVSGDARSNVVVNYHVTDICDLTATASGVAVPVHAINDGDTFIVEKKSLATIGTSAINVSAEAIDESGNRRQRTATLLIVD